MRIRMKRHLRGPITDWRPKSEPDVPDDEAERLIASGAAVAVEDAEPEPEAPEKAVVEPEAERAVKPKARGKKKSKAR